MGKHNAIDNAAYDAGTNKGSQRDHVLCPTCLLPSSIVLVTHDIITGSAVNGSLSVPCMCMGDPTGVHTVAVYIPSADHHFVDSLADKIRLIHAYLFYVSGHSIRELLCLCVESTTQYTTLLMTLARNDLL